MKTNHPAKVVTETWEEAIAKFYKVVELRVRYGMVMRTPAVEVKEMVINSILKEVKDLFKEEKK